MKKALFFFTLFIGLFAFKANAGITINRIKQTGVVRCGVRTTANAFAYQNKDKEWQGIDIEQCKLIASAVLGRPEAIQIVPVNKGEGFSLLQTGQIDVLGAATPWTMNIEQSSNTYFGGILYHSALAFIGHYNPNATSMKDYQGLKVCVENDPFLVYELEKYNKQHALDFRVMKLPLLSRAKELLYLKRCDMIFARIETLHSDYFKHAPKEVELAVLPEIVRSYPVGPYIADTDKEFYKTIRWLIYGIVKAEQKGVNAQNIEDFENTTDEEIENLLAQNPQEALKLGLDAGWLYRVIAQQGNYADVYERGLGDKSILKLHRSANRLVQDGGLMTSVDFKR